MPVYLSPYRGPGTRSDSFRPRGADGSWSSIDLRPVGSCVDGYALLHTPHNITDPRVYLLGVDKDDALPRPVERRVGSMLGLAFDGSNRTLSELVGEIMLRPLRGKQGWKPIQPALRHDMPGRYYEVMLGGERFFQLPVIAGGTFRTDDFNRADETPVAGNWTNVTRTNLAGNQLVVPPGTSEAYCYWNADTFTNDQYSQIQFTTLDGSSGLSLRGSGATLNYYGVQRYNGSSDELGIQIFKYVSGTYTPLETMEFTWTDGHYGRFTASGSTLNYYMDASNPPTTFRQTATDTTFTSGFVGVYGWNTAATRVYDNWEGGDLATPTGRIYTVSSGRRW